MKTRFLLVSALTIASKQLVNIESCAALFSELGADGLEQLAAAVYYRPSGDQEADICRQRNADAFTDVGGTRVGICTDRFSKLTRWEAAVRLIHETLHHAGMSEKPADSNALTSNEINQLVRANCRL